MSGTGEPTPSAGDDIPESVLRELKTVFADPEDDFGVPLPPVGREDGVPPAAKGPTTQPDAATAVRIDESPIGLPGVDVEVPESSEPKIVRIVDPGLTVSAETHEPTGRRARRKVRRERKAREKAARRTGAGVASTTPGDPPGSEAAGGGTTIVIGGDDELPDALYLDDVAEERLREVHGTESSRSGGATIVLGDELEASGAFDAFEVPARSMDPRVRARRIAVKRAAGRKRLVWAGVILLVIAIIVGTLAVFSSSLFAVEDVEVQGAAYTEYQDSAQLQAVIDDLTGEPILLVDTMKAEEQLEQLPWVERAIVTTDFPHSVLIDIRERLPLAAFRGTTDGKYRIIDRDGRVLDILDGQPADYMLISGQAPDTPRGEFAPEPLAQAARTVAALPAEIRSITTSASVDLASRDIELLLQPNVEVGLGDADDMDAKLARLLQVVRDGLLGIVRINVSTPEVSVTRG